MRNYPYFTRLKAENLPFFLIFLSHFRTINNIFTSCFVLLNVLLIITFRFSVLPFVLLNVLLSVVLTTFFPLFKVCSLGDENKNGLQTIQR
nr:MAG TPA: hypothetical protein [Caudoviricetes sp.]